MKRTLFLSILIVFILSIVGCNNQQTPTKELYKLQEQCGKQSEEWYKKYINENKPSLSYQSHYNKKLNKCFILVSVDTIKNSNHNDVNEYTGKILYDVNENKRYGMCVRDKKSDKIGKCDVLEKKGKSTEEWDILVKPYMTE